MKRKIGIFILLLCILSLRAMVLAAQPKQNLLVADFERHPNQLGGQVGVYGAGEPDLSNKDNPSSNAWLAYLGTCIKHLYEKEIRGKNGSL